MTREGHKISLPQEQMTQGLALAILLLLGGMSIAGPSGLLAWSENSQLLDQREARIAALSEERDRLRNLIDRLNPDSTDPDLASELVRQNLNVVHPDEVVLTLEPSSN